MWSEKGYFNVDSYICFNPKGKKKKRGKEMLKEQVAEMKEWVLGEDKPLSPK